MTSIDTAKTNVLTGWKLLAWLFALTMLAVPVAYFKIFTDFSFWDDEGALMAGVRQVLQGQKLYQEVFSRYGPFYHFYTCIQRVLSGTPVTHDVIRLSSLFPWLATASICALMVLRLTRSIALASIAHLFVVQSLSFFAVEPGHPQELCIMLLVCLPGCALLLDSPRWRRPALIALGFLAAALAMTKINIGIFVMVGLGLVLLAATPSNSLSRLAFWGFALTGLLLPYLLLRVHLDSVAAQAYCVVVTMSVASWLVVMRRHPLPKLLRFSDCWIVLASFLVTIVVLVLAVAFQGTSPYQILDALVLANVSFNTSWYFPVPLGPFWIAWGIAGAATAFLFARVRQVRPEAVAAAKLLFGLGVLSIRVSPWPVVLLGFATPLCWLVLFPARTSSEGGESERDTIPRALLCVIAVLQTLYAYPVAGSQLRFISVALMVVALVCLGDALAYLREWWPFPAARPANLARVVTAAVLALVALEYAASGYSRWIVYRSKPSAALPGAHRIHLPQKQASEYQWLVRNLKLHCDKFVGLPGVPSLDIWSGQKPPGDLNGNAWMYLSAQQQEKVITDFSRFPNACVVYSPDIVAFWNQGNLPLTTFPLARYILEHFKTVAQLNGYYFFMVRNERQVDAKSFTM